MKYCKTCLTPDTRPRIEFDTHGICNACHYAEKKKEIDWNDRHKEFVDLITKYKTNSGKWNCIVPWSGGKDSSANALRLKFEYGMNPLLVTFSPLLPTEVGIKNREGLLNLGFDHVYINTNRVVMRKLAKRFFIERGNPKIAWESGVNSAVMQVAANYKIPLVFYSEHGETEYGGNRIHSLSEKIRDYLEVVENQVGDDPMNWVNGGITLNDLTPFIYPEPEVMERVGTVATYMGYYFKWDQWGNYKYVKKYFDFLENDRGRTEGTFTRHDSLDDKTDDLYYYMQYIKFGFGRAVRDASRMIQNGHLTREEGLELALKYDGELPYRYLDEVLQYLDLKEEEFYEIIDKHRNSEIWTKTSGKWQLIDKLQ